MHPILISWGNLELPSWHAFYVMGALAALAALLRLGRLHEPQIPRPDLGRIFALCYVGGWFGARALSIGIEETSTGGLLNLLSALLTFGPMTFYGGAIVAAGLGFAYARLKRIPFAHLADIGLPAGLIALAIGRVGCFLNGDDFGKAVTVTPAPFWAVTFPNLGDNLPRWPVQLMESAAVTLLVLILWRRFLAIRLALRPGAVALLAVAGYANIRFLLEFLRDDFRGSLLGTWVSTSQFISLVLLAGCAAMAPWAMAKK